MRDYIRQIIKDRAEEIRQEVAKGILYGEPIDLDNPDMVLVAAVCLEEQKRLSHFTVPYVADKESE